MNVLLLLLLICVGCSAVRTIELHHGYDHVDLYIFAKARAMGGESVVVIDTKSRKVGIGPVDNRGCAVDMVRKILDKHHDSRPLRERVDKLYPQIDAIQEKCKDRPVTPMSPEERARWNPPQAPELNRYAAVPIMVAMATIMWVIWCLRGCKEMIPYEPPDETPRAPSVSSSSYYSHGSSDDWDDDDDDSDSD